MSVSRMIPRRLLAQTVIAGRTLRCPPTAVHAARTIFTSTSHPSGRTLGVAAALKARDDPNYEVRPQIFDEFSIPDGVAVVSIVVTPHTLSFRP
jgi:hypothetical protein